MVSLTKAYLTLTDSDALHSLKVILCNEFRCLVVGAYFLDHELRLDLVIVQVIEHTFGCIFLKNVVIDRVEVQNAALSSVLHDLEVPKLRKHLRDSSGRQFIHLHLILELDPNIVLMSRFALHLALVPLAWVQVETSTSVKLVEHNQIQVLLGKRVIQIDLVVFVAVRIDILVHRSRWLLLLLAILVSLIGSCLTCKVLRIDLLTSRNLIKIIYFLSLLIGFLDIGLSILTSLALPIVTFLCLFFHLNLLVTVKLLIDLLVLKDL